MVIACIETYLFRIVCMATNVLHQTARFFRCSGEARKRGWVKKCDAFQQASGSTTTLNHCQEKAKSTSSTFNNYPGQRCVEYMCQNLDFPVNISSSMPAASNRHLAMPSVDTLSQ
jgi:hypothetical protein